MRPTVRPRPVAKLLRTSSGKCAVARAWPFDGVKDEASENPRWKMTHEYLLCELHGREFEVRSGTVGEVDQCHGI